MVKKLMKRLLILLAISINLSVIASEASEDPPKNQPEFRGTTSDLLTFSTKVPIELNHDNKKVLGYSNKPERNVQIEQEKTLPWIKLASALIAILVLLGLKSVPKTKEQSTILIKTAREKANFKLELLEPTKHESQETFYAQLSDILRSYIEDRYQIKALKKTTEEFLNTLQENPLTVPFPETELSRFLILSDRVKFAKEKPSIQECSSGYDIVKKIIEH